jgi:hypothetical protein
VLVNNFSMTENGENLVLCLFVFTSAFSGSLWMDCHDLFGITNKNEPKNGTLLNLTKIKVTVHETLTKYVIISS